MIQLTVLYGHPQDPAAFDRYYQQTHSVLIMKAPEVKDFIANKPGPAGPQEPSPYYLITELYFESMEALQAGLQSLEGAAAAGDTQNFATGGVTLVIGEMKVYDPVSIG